MVPPKCRRSIEIPPLADGLTVHIVWVSEKDVGRPARATLVALRSEPRSVGFMALGVWGEVDETGRGRRLELAGVSNVGTLRSKGATLAVHGGFCSDLAELDIEGGIAGATIGELGVDVLDGRCVVVDLDDGPCVERASGARFVGASRQAHMTCRDVADSTFENIAVSVETDGLVVRCAGEIRIVRAAGARILADASRRLVLGAVSDDRTPLEDRPELDDAVLSGVYLAPGSIKKLLEAVGTVAQLDLAPAACSEVIAALPIDVRLQVAERLHSVIVLKARSPQTVDAASAALLEARRERTRRVSLEYLLLSTARLFEYGQSLRRPLVVWAVLTAAIVLHRAEVAIRDKAGLIGLHPHFHIEFTEHLWYRAGDSILSTILLPANWVRLQETAPAVGLSGGYLSAARLVLLLVVILFLTAARRRLRVPRGES
jgi:hypothetical protein